MTQIKYIKVALNQSDDRKMKHNEDQPLEKADIFLTIYIGIHEYLLQSLKTSDVKKGNLSRLFFVLETMKEFLCLLHLWKFSNQISLLWEGQISPIIYQSSIILVPPVTES